MDFVVIKIVSWMYEGDALDLVKQSRTLHYEGKQQSGDQVKTTATAWIVLIPVDERIT